MQHDIAIPEAARRDGHDNNWLLLEFLLAVRLMSKAQRVSLLVTKLDLHSF